MKKNLSPQFSRETAYRLWKSGKMTDNYYTSHFMTPEEAREYYHQKLKDKAREEAERKKQEQLIQEQIDEQFEKKILPAIQDVLNAF